MTTIAQNYLHRQILDAALALGESSALHARSAYPSAAQFAKFRSHLSNGVPVKLFLVGFARVASQRLGRKPVADAYVARYWEIQGDAPHAVFGRSRGASPEELLARGRRMRNPYEQAALREALQEEFGIEVRRASGPRGR